MVAVTVQVMDCNCFRISTLQYGNDLAYQAEILRDFYGMIGKNQNQTKSKEHELT